MNYTNMFSKLKLVVLLLVFLLPVFHANSQEKKFLDFSLAGSIGGVTSPTGTDESKAGIVMHLGPEFVFPKLKSAIEFRLGYGKLNCHDEKSFESDNPPYRSNHLYEVEMFSYGLAYKYLIPIIDTGTCFVFDNEFSWANLNAKIKEGKYRSSLSNYFFYTFRLGLDIKADDLVRVMPWVGLSSFNMKPLLNKPQHPFGGEDFPFTMGIAIKMF